MRRALTRRGTRSGPRRRARSCVSERRTVSTGTAKPTPSPPPPVDRICELIPITRPRASTSGPPELPRLIAASVWIASLIGEAGQRLDRAVQARDDADRQRLRLAEGLPIGDDRRADLQRARRAERQRAQRRGPRGRPEERRRRSSGRRRRSSRRPGCRRRTGRRPPSRASGRRPARWSRRARSSRSGRRRRGRTRSPRPPARAPRSSTPPPPNTLNTVTTPGASRS